MRNVEYLGYLGTLHILAQGERSRVHKEPLRLSTVRSEAIGIALVPAEVYACGIASVRD